MILEGQVIINIWIFKIKHFLTVVEILGTIDDNV